jgi:putative transposase
VKYACIARHRGEFAVRLMCRALDVSPSGFYAAARRAPSARAVVDEQLGVAIRVAHRASRRTYGSPRVHAELRAHGLRCGRKRVARLMREAGLVAKRRRRQRPRTTESRHTHAVAPNVLDRRFTVAEIGAPDRVWAADITYLPAREGWLYLAAVLDLGTRRVVGWSTRATLGRELALEALQMALEHRRPGPGVLHHSDRGSQYASGDYQALLAQHGMTCSMSKKGDCFDNAVAESLFATLETELVAEADWHTRAEARAAVFDYAVFDYIEVWYNRQRRHSSLGYLSPAAYEQQLRGRQARAA